MQGVCNWTDHWVDNAACGKKWITKIMVVTFTWRQNIGHIGTTIVICGVHGHRDTMAQRCSHPKYTEWWNKLATTLRQYNVQFLCGDFNMSLTQVVPELHRRDIIADACAWTPWLHANKNSGGIFLGIDSMAMFHIGGRVKCKLTWDFESIGELLKEAARPPGEPQLRQAHTCGKETLHTYPKALGKNADTPGQLWNCYRGVMPVGKKAKANQAPPELDKLLEGLLIPSTCEPQLRHIQSEYRKANPGTNMCAYLRLKQKPMNQDEWLVDPQTTHPGAHYPLAVWTENSRSRSQTAKEARNTARPYQKQWWAQEAIREQQSVAMSASPKAAMKTREQSPEQKTAETAPAYVELPAWTHRQAVGAQEARQLGMLDAFTAFTQVLDERFPLDKMATSVGRVHQHSWKDEKWKDEDGWKDGQWREDQWRNGKDVTKTKYTGVSWDDWPQWNESNWNGHWSER